MIKKIGMCAVDSGQLMMTDPCYLKDWKDNEMNIEEEYSLEATKDCEYKHDKKTIKIKKGDKFKVISTKGIWFSIVELINKKILKVLKKEYLNLKQDYSYSGACSATLSEDSAGQLSNNGFDEVAVAFSTGYGDGVYPVYAEYEGGRIVKVWVEFVEKQLDEEEEDEDEL